jgi:hypothetical protein
MQRSLRSGNTNRHKAQHETRNRRRILDIMSQDGNQNHNDKAAQTECESRHIHQAFLTPSLYKLETPSNGVIIFVNDGQSISQFPRYLL